MRAFRGLLCLFAVATKASTVSNTHANKNALNKHRAVHAPNTRRSQPLHAVVFLVDDLGYGDTHHRGAEYPTSNIDTLALGGIRLNQSYVMQLCSPTRGSLLSSRYSYNVAMDGNVLNAKDDRCLNTSVSTVGNHMQSNGVKTAFIGKYDIGSSEWACTANCRGFDYWLGYYGAAEDYYLHGGAKSLDFHENYQQAPQYRGEYSTSLFARKAVEFARNATAQNATQPTFVYLAFQAVHGPIEAPPKNYTDQCAHITEVKRKTYCAMMQALDEAIGAVVGGYRTLGMFNDTLFLFLSDNGGQNLDGGFNRPLRGQKATVWEGGVRSQTFLHWSGFSSPLIGSMYAGMAHVTDWGPTLVAALGHPPPTPNAHEPPFDGMNLWPALTSGSASPRTEMLLSLRDVGQCANEYPGCKYPGQLAYRKGKYKLLYGHPSLRGKAGLQCTWSGKRDPEVDYDYGVEKGGGLTCNNGWGRPKDTGASRPPPPLPPQPGQPKGSSGYSYGAVLLFDIEADPLEEHDLAAEQPEVVKELTAKLEAYIALHIDQGVYPDPGAKTSEPCGDHLSCSVPWKPHKPDNRCVTIPSPAPPGPGPSPGPGPGPGPSPSGNKRSHLTGSDNWKVSKTQIELQGWACYSRDDKPQTVELVLDGAAPVQVVADDAVPKAKACIGGTLGRFRHTFQAKAGQNFESGTHKVTGTVVGEGALGNTPQCLKDGKASSC